MILFATCGQKSFLNEHPNSRLDGDEDVDFDVDVDDAEVGDFVPDPVSALVRIGGRRERFRQPELAFLHLVSGLSTTFKGKGGFPEVEFSFRAWLRAIGS